MFLENGPNRCEMIGIVLQDKTHPLAIMQYKLQEGRDRRLLRSSGFHTKKDTANGPVIPRKAQVERKNARTIRGYGRVMPLVAAVVNLVY
jgi:hypothetical protein